MTPNEELKKQAVTAPQTGTPLTPEVGRPHNAPGVRGVSMNPTAVSKPQVAAQPVSKPQVAAQPVSKPQTAAQPQTTTPGYDQINALYQKYLSEAGVNSDKGNPKGPWYNPREDGPTYNPREDVPWIKPTQPSYTVDERGIVQTPPELLARGMALQGGPTYNPAQAVPSGTPMVGLDQALERSQQQPQPTPTEKPTIQPQVNPFQQTGQQQTAGTDGVGDALKAVMDVLRQRYQTIAGKQRQDDKAMQYGLDYLNQQESDYAAKPKPETTEYNVEPENETTTTTAPTAPTSPTGTDGTHTPPTSVVEKQKPFNKPTDTSIYDTVQALYEGLGGNIPEGHDYSQQIMDMYNALMGYLPENQDYSQQISDIYDKLNESTLAQLQASYDQVQHQLDEAALKIPQQYQAQSRALEAQNAQNQRNMNEMLAASGLNTGAGGQARLAQNAAYMQGSAGIKQSQAEAQAALERERVAKEQDYQNAITAALKDNDYQRAVALTQELKDYQQRAQQIAQMAMSIGSQQAGAMQSEWNRQAQEAYQLWQAGESLNAEQRQALMQAMYHDQNSALQQAQILASYGDFSGFANLYGEDAARQMQQLWLAQNPQFAFMTGQMTPDQYFQMTGQYAPGHQPTYYGTTTTDTDTTTDQQQVGTVSDDYIDQQLSMLAHVPTSERDKIAESFVKMGDQLTDAQKARIAAYFNTH